MIDARRRATEPRRRCDGAVFVWDELGRLGLLEDRLLKFIQAVEDRDAVAQEGLAEDLVERRLILPPGAESGFL